MVFSSIIRRRRSQFVFHFLSETARISMIINITRVHFMTLKKVRFGIHLQKFACEASNLIFIIKLQLKGPTASLRLVLGVDGVAACQKNCPHLS